MWQQIKCENSKTTQQAKLKLFSNPNLKFRQKRKPIDQNWIFKRTQISNYQIILKLSNNFQKIVQAPYLLVKSRPRAKHEMQSSNIHLAETLLSLLLLLRPLIISLACFFSLSLPSHQKFGFWFCFGSWVFRKKKGEKQLVRKQKRKSLSQWKKGEETSSK